MQSNHDAPFGIVTEIDLGDECPLPTPSLYGHLGIFSRCNIGFELPLLERAIEPRYPALHI